MINNKLVLHAIIFKKDMYKTANEALNKAIDMFPHEKIKGFVRETMDSFRVRVRPKTQFIKTDYVSKIINPDITIVMGKLHERALMPEQPKGLSLKEEPKARTSLQAVRALEPSRVHYIDFEKIRSKKLPK
jgi:hypothetical protein